MHANGAIAGDERERLAASTSRAARYFAEVEKSFIRKSLSPVMRLVNYVYEERQFFLFALCHFFATMICWAHFFYVKYRQQEARVPETANRYWAKRLIPPLEFGSMHAILFQMALIPLTMSRSLVAYLSTTPLAEVVPLNRIVGMHIHIGYTMVLIVFLATVTFFGFFGALCQDQKDGIEPLGALGERTFCDKFTSEIMCTGYGILASLLLVAVSSFFRNRIPYEVFYTLHHLVFVMYAISIAHTMDDEQRDGKKDRSQTFKWFSATLWIYVADRLLSYLNSTKVPAVQLRALGERGVSSRAVILRVARPRSFTFRPGQWASIAVPEIDVTWHPFSIGSAPMQSHLEFFVEVYDDESWTDKLWALAAEREGRPADVQVSVMGPFGAAFSHHNMADVEHLVAISSGTGVVPMLSMLKDLYTRLLQLEPVAYVLAMRRFNARIKKLIRAEVQGSDSTVQMIGRSCGLFSDSEHLLERTLELGTSVARHIRDSQRDFRARQLARDGSATRRKLFRVLYQTILLRVEALGLTTLVSLELLLASLMISWSHNESRPTERMARTLHLMNWILGAGALGVLRFLDRLTSDPISWCADVSILAVTATALVFLEKEHAFDGNRAMSGYQLTALVALAAYRAARYWTSANVSDAGRVRRAAKKRGLLSMAYVESFNFIWVTRNAYLAKYLLAEVAQYQALLAERFGKFLPEVASVRIYVTDKSERSCKDLESYIAAHASLVEHTTVEFQRPELDASVMHGVFKRLLDDDVHHSPDPHIIGASGSRTLVAFCGGPRLGREIAGHVAKADAVSHAISGLYGAHRIFFMQENYGIGDEKKAPAKKGGARIQP